VVFIKLHASPFQGEVRRGTGKIAIYLPFPLLAKEGIQSGMHSSLKCYRVEYKRDGVYA
jgi:hypothetical protein